VIRLLVGYDAAVAELVRELEASSEGDRLTLRSYLIEPGASTERVLVALRGALERGAQVAIAADGTWASWLSRFWERTGTRFPAFAALADEHRERASAELLRVVDHSKYAIFERARGASCAIVGGMNLGDRFAPWRDFAVRVEGGELVAALLRALRGEDVPPVRGVKFVAAVPGAPSSPVKAAFDRIAEDTSLGTIRIAMAYVDRAGARIVERALARGARVELTVPGRANVYQHSNQKTVARLLRAGGALTVHACRSMVHAKALVAADASGPRLALLGSANLKRNSLVHFGELDAAIDDDAFARTLAVAFDVLLAESEPLTAPRWRAFAALVEERFG
jgi:phosphatidylserine/phosphatidylglycerophosphate/cardiolipin synthase-like enzyme